LRGVSGMSYPEAGSHRGLCHVLQSVSWQRTRSDAVVHRTTSRSKSVGSVAVDHIQCQAGRFRDLGGLASPSPQATLRVVEGSHEDTVRRCGQLRGRSRFVVSNAG